MTEHVPGSHDEAERRCWRTLEAAALAVYLTLAGSYAFIIPQGAGPDEAEHLDYARSLATKHQLPALPGTALATDPGRIATHQAQHPPAYYLLLTPLYWLLGSTPSLLYRVARLLSVLIGLGAILFIRRAGQILFPLRPSVVALGVVFASTFGTFAYVCGTVNNEPLAALVVSAGLCLAARALKAQQPVAPMALLGLALGAGLLVKLTASVLVAPIVVVAIGRAMSRKRGWRRPAETAGLISVGFACALAVSGWWFVRTARVYGTPMMRAHHRPALESWSDILTYPVACTYVVLGNVEELVRSLWGPRWLRSDAGYFYGVFCQMLGLAPAPILVLPGIASLAVLILATAGIALAWRGHGNKAPELDRPQKCFVLAGTSAIMWLILGLEYQMLFVDGNMALFAGRYAPVFLPALGLLLGIGIQRLIPGRFRRTAGVIIMGALLAYNLSVMHAVYLFQQSS